MSDVTTCLEMLAAAALPDGGWGYGPGQPAHLEPTCLALLALSLEPERYAGRIELGLAAIGHCAGPDGAYRVPGAREEATWPTALVLFVQAALGRPRAELERTAARLLAIRGRIPEHAAANDLLDIDPNLVGWPWAQGTFSWAEPTAWACLALRRAGYGGHPRVAEGLRLLLDRAADEGGINYGNRRVFGRLTEPLPEPTAFMLLALQGGNRDERTLAAVRYLAEQGRSGTDLQQLCWARLTLDLYRDVAEAAEVLPALDGRIAAAYAEREATPWVGPAPHRVALTALALAAGERNAFRIPQGEGRAEVPALTEPAARRLPFGERVKRAVRGLAVEGAGRLRATAPATVHIARAEDYNGDLADVLRRQYETFRERVPLAGKRVVLKPNLVEYHRDKVINTHPHVVAAVIELCRREGAAEVIVAEGPGHCRNAEHLVSASGLGDVLRHHGVRFVDLNHDEPVRTLNLGRLTRLDYLYLARTIVSADVLISLPKLKTHHWAGATLALKNLFGTLPGTCYGWPKNELHWRGIDNSIVDIALTRTPDLAIVDGIIGMEGDGPLNGTPKPLGALVMGTDLVAVDATCCRLMGLDPGRIGYLTLGQHKRLGVTAEAAIRQLGEQVADVARPFATLPHLDALRLGRPA